MRPNIKKIILKILFKVSKQYSKFSTSVRILLKKCYLSLKKFSLGREDYDEWLERVTKFDRNAYREMRSNLFTPQEW